MQSLRTLTCCFWSFFLAPLSAGAQPQSLPNASPADLAAGQRIFAAQCAWCHGTEGTGGAGPVLQRTTLRHAPDDRTLIQIVRNGIPGTEMPGFGLSLTETTAFQTAAYVRSLGRTKPMPIPGNAERGAAVYSSLACDACHVVSGRGGILGPELTSIGSLRGPSHLRESIVTPEAGHPPGYLVVRAVTKERGDVRGIRVTEDVFWIHIRDLAGTVHTLQKANLQRLDRELTATLMPSYAERLSEAGLDDLIAYLASLKGER
jgi:putative heme-binding domain-containing protein